MLKITVLIENSAPGHLICEHGLSLHLNYDNHSYLLDTGTSGIFVQNARQLGIDLEQVSAAILSHGHDDHAGGLPAFFACNDHAKVYARPAAEPVYQQDVCQSAPPPAGVDPDLFFHFRHRFDLEDGPRALAPGLYLFPDAVSHEQSLVAETSLGLVVMNSCCHAGAEHIVADILTHFPAQRVYAILGGFHLVGRNGMGSLGVAPETVKTLSHQLVEVLGVARIYTGHCTGHPAFSLLEEEAPGHVFSLNTGDVLTFL